MRRTIVIGDVHGCYTEAVKLLELCNVTSDDRVIFIGDLVDRGPDSAKCVELAMSYERPGEPAAVLGNHEDVHLTYRDQEERGFVPVVTSKTHEETRRQLVGTHYNYLRTLPLFIRLPEYNAAVVHAGVFPNRTLEEQKREHLLHAQMICPWYGEATMWPGTCPHTWKFWTHYWTGPERIIFGHSNLDEPLVTDKVVGIDGGVCFGGYLRAVILPTWEIVSVPGLANHGKGSRGRNGPPIQKYLIHGNVSTYS